MSSLQFDDACLLFALGRESMAFRRAFRPQQRFPDAPCRALFCGPSWLTVLVMETGVGTLAADSACDWALGSPLLGKVPYRPKLVVSAGFAGALQDDFAVGDVLLATEVVDAEGNLWPTTWPGELPAGEWRPALRRGRLLTMPRLIGSAIEKERLGREHQAAAVDMEAARIARKCQQRGIPFGSVRVISDDRSTALSPRMVEILKGGQFSPWRGILAVIRSPGLVVEMLRLAKSTRLAANQLGLALGELLTLTLPIQD